MARVFLSSRARAHARFGIVFSAILGAQSLVAPPVFAQDAKAQLAAGDKAAQTKDWSAAITAYDAANKATPSDAALDGLANAHFQLKHDTEAYAAYEEWLKTYGAKNAGKKAANEKRLKEIADRTGSMEIAVNEPGATITIDDKPVGKSPLASPLRLSVGPHRVRVQKDGFLAFDGTPNVAQNVPNKVDVKLEAQSGKGRLSVKEKTGKAVRVFVDGVDMGDAPWAGDVDAGQHEVVVRSPTLVGAPEKVTIERGKQRDVEIEASSSTASVKISTVDGKGLIYIDDKLVGEGSFSGDIPSGVHKLRITREGYESFGEEITLEQKQNFVRNITMSLSGAIQTSAVEKDKRALEGIYGGFAIPLWFGSGYGSSVEKACDNKPVELAGCDPGSGIGSGLQGFVGYHWDPVGVEFFFGGGYDQVGSKLDWNASSTDPGLGPDPARTEEFTVRRIGGFGAFRVRYTYQIEKVRFTVAGGVGLSYRALFLTRDASAKADSNQRDVFVPDSQTYLSPLITLEPAVYFRLGQPTALGVGFSFQMEAAGSFSDNPRTQGDGGRKIGLVGITTPSYELASSTQIFFGPFIGMIFGP